MHGYFSFLSTDDCQLKTYYSQEKRKAKHDFIFLGFLSDIKEKEMSGRIDKIVPKNKKKL
jgi:hypothetical protein